MATRQTEEQRLIMPQTWHEVHESVQPVAKALENAYQGVVNKNYYGTPALDQLLQRYKMSSRVIHGDDLVPPELHWPGREYEFATMRKDNPYMEKALTGYDSAGTVFRYTPFGFFGRSMLGETKLRHYRWTFSPSLMRVWFVTVPSYDLEQNPGICHGGVTGAIFDEICGTLGNHCGSCMTIYLNTTFKAPIRTLEPVVFEAFLQRLEGRKMFLYGTARDGNGKLLASCETLFVLIREAPPKAMFIWIKPPVNMLKKAAEEKKDKEKSRL
eukprot:Clim_evm35s2 gene=Clim_evmTU35s2